MRTSVNLILAGALVATAFGSVAAVEGMADCDYTDRAPITRRAGMERQIAPPPPFTYTSRDVTVASDGKLWVEISWLSTGDFDLAVNGATGSVASRTDNLVRGDTTVEQVFVGDVKACDTFTIDVENFLGDFVTDQITVRAWIGG